MSRKFTAPLDYTEKLILTILVLIFLCFVLVGSIDWWGVID